MLASQRVSGIPSFFPLPKSCKPTTSPGLRQRTSRLVTSNLFPGTNSVLEIARGPPLGTQACPALAPPGLQNGEYLQIQSLKDG